MNNNLKNKKNLIIALILIIFIAAIFSIFYTVFGYVQINKINLPYFFYQLGKFMALLGFLFISLLIISGDTARFFDRFFGIDRIIKFQRKFAIITYFIVFSHPLFIILSGRYSLMQLIPNFAILPLAIGAISFYIFAGIMISSLLYKRISYKYWQYIHIFTYVLFFFILYHGINMGSSIYSPLIKIMFLILVIFVMIGIVYRTNYKLKQRKNKFFVRKVKDETGDTFTLIVKPDKKISFKPGQFFFLRLEGRKLYARHPFSISNSPDEKELNFTIKSSGRFTKEAYNLKSGDEVKIEGPFGNFILNNDGKELVFLAGGVGITPFLSMIKNNKNKGVKQKITLLYGCKTKKDIIFKKELDLIHESWFTKIYVLSKENKNWGKKGIYESGRINKEILIKYIQDFNNKKFYICGPQLMNSHISKILHELGVKNGDIVFEDFFW